MHRIALVLSLAFVAACGGAPSSAGGSGAVSASGAEPTDPFADDLSSVPEPTPGAVEHTGAIERLGITPPETPWASMSQFDREMYMVGKVLPIMRELFARQDAARFGDVGCETCHGEDMRAVAFRMPASSAIPVPPPGSPGWARLERQFPESFRFMRDTVTPTMGTLLGIEGYTCNHCHPGSPAR